MRVIVHTTEVINHIVTIEVDLEAVRAYYGKYRNVALIDDIDNWAIKNYLLDDRELWLDQMYADDSDARFTNWSHKLDEINVIA